MAFHAVFAGSPERITGPPTSANAASSFHAYYVAAPDAKEVQATVEVINAPTVAELYFWALQATFMKNGVAVAAAHFGLQHHPQYPSNGAINFGGYEIPSNTLLSGTTSSLPSTLNNPNTRDFVWQAGQQYRYRIFEHAAGIWRGTITDLGTSTETVVRDLFVDADELAAPVVWTEAFCDCDHTTAAVRWTDLAVIDDQTTTHTISQVNLSYQTYEDGGCSNTDSSIDATGLVQRTNVARVNPHGATLTMPGVPTGGGPLVDQVVVVPDEGTVSVPLSAGVASDWAIRIDDPLDQFNSPNNDPGSPEPVDDAWQPITALDGQSQIFLAVDEEWASGINPDTHGNPTESFFLRVRATAVVGGAIQLATLEVRV